MITIVVSILVFMAAILIVSPYSSFTRGGLAGIVVLVLQVLGALAITLLWVLIVGGTMYYREDVTYTPTDSNKYKVNDTIHVFKEDIITLSGDNNNKTAVKVGDHYYIKEDK